MYTRLASIFSLVDKVQCLVQNPATSTPNSKAIGNQLCLDGACRRNTWLSKVDLFMLSDT